MSTRRAVRLADAPPLAAEPGFRLCPVCGTAKRDTTGGAGRPWEHCSPTCRDIAHLTRLLDSIEDTAHPRAWLALRRRLWRTLNGRAWNRGVKAARSDVA